MNTHSGSCLCGTVKFQIKGDFESFYLCHCSRCQKDTGSAHGANLFSQSAQLHWLSGEDAVTTFTLPGTRHCRSFCKVCGSALPMLQTGGALLVVPAGCLDTSVDIQPTASIFTADRAAWCANLAALRGFEGLPE